MAAAGEAAPQQVPDHMARVAVPALTGLLSALAAVCQLRHAARVAAQEVAEEADMEGWQDMPQVEEEGARAAALERQVDATRSLLQEMQPRLMWLQTAQDAGVVQAAQQLLRLQKCYEVCSVPSVSAHGQQGQPQQLLLCSLLLLLVQQALVAGPVLVDNTGVAYHEEQVHSVMGQLHSLVHTLRQHQQQGVQAAGDAWWLAAVLASTARLLLQAKPPASRFKHAGHPAAGWPCRWRRGGAGPGAPAGPGQQPVAHLLPCRACCHPRAAHTVRPS